MTFRAFVAVAAVCVPMLAVAQGARSVTPGLKVYESCSFPDGLSITDVQSMPGDVKDRPVQIHGTTQQVPLLAGRRITFSYPGGEPMVSVKLEQLPADNYTANRALLLQDFDDIVASDKGVAKNTTRPAKISGFSVVGLDRKTISGNTGHLHAAG